MIKKLTKKEEEYLDDLEKNCDKYVEKYRKECEKKLKEGKRKELEEELGHLESYWEGVRLPCACGNPACMHGCGHPKCKNMGPISDIFTNIQFQGAKLGVLKELLGK